MILLVEKMAVLQISTILQSKILLILLLVMKWIPPLLSYIIQMTLHPTLLRNIVVHWLMPHAAETTIVATAVIVMMIVMKKRKTMIDMFLLWWNGLFVCVLYYFTACDVSCYVQAASTCTVRNFLSFLFLYFRCSKCLMMCDVKSK